ncbi:Acetamidase [Aspergillus nidulans FGSC A4] [Rhizoctonia solani]|uniref:Acetamidase [Aspergillus nidulans FGSC A4] n=1 Tax=Rhizoctonia solani TaxID=456999 RepID=A0A0K6G4D5_9AGAM|nr:Acetamidase [Aspergillus nidulans FGSC A4] [Rhizoctonia solani]
MTSAENSSLSSAPNPLTKTNGPKLVTDWETIAARKREDRANRLKPYPHWSLGDLAPAPSHKNVTSLVHARLTDRSFLASDATYAAQELTNCVTEVMFTQVLARAHGLDAHILQTGEVVGPLHGIPVNIKDHICVKGEDTATGFVTWAGRSVAEEDAAIVQILRAAGAVTYVKTTNPQSLFATSMGTQPTRIITSGGSSGGEGAPIGSRTSLLGVGTDVGGSILSSQRPIGVVWTGMEKIVGVIGPMAHSARGLELFFRVISDSKPWNIDFSTLCMPWNPVPAEIAAKEKLVLGFFIDDGVVTPHPLIVERLNKTQEALVAAGHEVIDWTPMDHMEAFELTAKLYMLDGGEDIRAILAESGEPPIPQVASIFPDPKEGECTLGQSWAMNTWRDQFRVRALKHWNETALRTKGGRPVDAILCPAAPTLAPPHGTTRWIGCTAYWNLLDLPAVVFPSGKPFDASTWDAAAGSSSDELRNPIEEFIKTRWKPETFDGAPIGLQLVARRWQEENLFAMLKQVEDAVARIEKY